MHKGLTGWLAGLAARLPAGLAVWRSWLGPVVVSRRPQHLQNDELPMVEDMGAWGCGWFDSSHELVHGLQVQEDSAEALIALPLATWLDVELRSCSPAALSA